MISTVTALTLLGDVRWRGAPVAGERSQALLAALAAAGGRPVRAERLIDLVWGDEAPANAAKGLQVLVSRTRTALGADAIVRDAVGYRLGVDPAEVDSVRLAALARDAAAALRRRRRPRGHAGPRGAGAGGRAAARRSTTRPTRWPSVRRAAAGDLATARVILAQASSRTGAHAEALPALEAAHAERADDEALLADLLRSEAAVRGPGAALERYEAYRQDLLERLGTNPGERLAPRAPRPAGARPPGPRAACATTRARCSAATATSRRLRALLDRRARGLDHRAGRPRQDAARPRPRAATPTQPVVHFVELVGVTSAEDVVGEVGSVLGVRDSVSAQRTLTPEQRARRPRPHRAAARRRRRACSCSTTASTSSTRWPSWWPSSSRRPPTCACSRRAARRSRSPPSASTCSASSSRPTRPRCSATARSPRARTPSCPRTSCASIVTRLDGLPLAIELAAAKVRAMSVEEIDRRLEDRFALLRGGDRSAPDRHQTLLAVIDWSWNLLDEAERRALRRLALFNDGFTLEAADAVLGDGALDAVQGLVDQSLLSVRDAARRRPLPDARDRPRVRPPAARRRRRGRRGARGQAGVGDRATPAATAPACSAATSSRRSTRSPPRRSTSPTSCATRSPTATAARSSSCSPRSGLFWTIRGEHARLIALTGRGRRRGARLAAAAGARGHRAGRAGDRR